MEKIKQFLKNKNTVTFIGVIACVLILYFSYNFKVKQATEPIKVPVASKQIEPRTKITEDMIKYIEVPPAYATRDVVRSKDNIVGKYCAHNTIIPTGSVFYDTVLKTKTDMPDSALDNIGEDQTLVNLPVTMESSYYNTILPGNYIDIYIKTQNSANQIVFGKLFKNVKILAVKDSKGENVFESLEVSRTPATIIFAMSNENHILMGKTIALSRISDEALKVQIEPVPLNTTFADEEGAEEQSSSTLVRIIESRTGMLED